MLNPNHYPWTSPLLLRQACVPWAARTVYCGVMTDWSAAAARGFVSVGPTAGRRVKALVLIDAVLERGAFSLRQRPRRCLESCASASVRFSGASASLRLLLSALASTAICPPPA